MAKRKNGGFELLAAMPWPVPLVLGVIGFVVVRYGIGWAMGSSQNAILAGLGRQLSSRVVRAIRAVAVRANSKKARPEVCLSP